MKRKIKIKDGRISFIYNDKMAGFLDLGEAQVKRASHVEPVVVDRMVKWNADLSPVDGPMLGPFDLRKDALAAEVKWLETNLGAIHAMGRSD